MRARSLPPSRGQDGREVATDSLTDLPGGSQDLRSEDHRELVFLRGHDADRRLREVATVRTAARPVLGALAARLVGERLYEHLGYRCLGDFAREHLGVGPRTVREWARVHVGLGELPRLRAALLNGDVSFAVVRLVVGVATPATDAACLECVRGRTVRAVRTMVAAVKGVEMPVPAPERVWVRFPCTAKESVLWRAAVELARRMEGEEIPLWRCAEAIAAEAASAVGGPPSPGPGSDGSSTADPSEASTSGLQEVAYPLADWSDGGHHPLPTTLAPLVRGLPDCSAREIGDRMERAVRALRDVDFETGRVLAQMGKRRLFAELGFESLARYVDERLDLSARNARRLMALARAESCAPSVATAFRDGRLHAMQAAELARRVDEIAAQAWVDRAQQVTFRRLLDELEEDAAGRPGVIAFRAPPEVASLFLQMMGRSGSLSRLLGHAIATWVEQGRRFRDYADFERDGFRCVVPGCTARRNLHSHHIRFRSAGGPNAAWNRVTLCASHHERALHRNGALRIRGVAPDALIFELGEDRAERFSSGDVRL